MAMGIELADILAYGAGLVYGGACVLVGMVLLWIEF